MTSSSSSTARAGNVVTLSRSRVACPVCDGLAVARIKGAVENTTCLDHFGQVAQDTPTDGFSPLTIHWIFPRGDAA